MIKRKRTSDGSCSGLVGLLSKFSVIFNRALTACSLASAKSSSISFRLAAPSMPALLTPEDAGSSTSTFCRQVSPAECTVRYQVDNCFQLIFGDLLDTGFEEPEPPFLSLNSLSGCSLSPLPAAHQLPFSPMSPSKSIFASSSLNMFTGLGINLSSMGSGGGVTI